MADRASPLDAAWAAAEAEGAPERARLRFFALLLETPLCMPLAAEPEGDAAPEPLVFPLESGPCALAFDDDARMAAFFDAPTAYVSMPGRAAVEALAGAGLGLGLNLGDEASGALFDAEAMRWLAREAAGGLAESALSGAVAVAPPDPVPPALLAALAEAAAGMPGLVEEALLARLRAGESGGRLVLFVVPFAAARRAGEGLAAALGRAAAPHEAPDDALEIGVIERDSPLLRAARAQGLALRAAAREERPAPSAPAAPPRLR